jgi:hypothetical protein
MNTMRTMLTSLGAYAFDYAEVLDSQPDDFPVKVGIDIEQNNSKYFVISVGYITIDGTNSKIKSFMCIDKGDFDGAECDYNYYYCFINKSGVLSEISRCYHGWQVESC